MLLTAVTVVVAAARATKATKTRRKAVEIRENIVDITIGAKAARMIKLEDVKPFYTED